MRIAVTLLLAFSSSLPLPLVMGTLDAWMASEHVDLRTIGLFSLVQAPYTFKVLWAPLLDRFVPPFLNRRTGWMAITQVALILLIARMGLSDPVGAPGALAMAAFLVAFFSATQDIVIDGYRAELLTDEERGQGAGVTVLGGRIALLVGGAVALVLSDRIPWRGVYLLMAGLMGIGLVTAIVAPAPDERTIPPKTIRDAVVRPFSSFMRRPGAVAILLLIVVYKLGDVVAGKMLTPFLIQMGFTKTMIGTVNKGFGMISTIIGALAGGSIIKRVGIWRSLWIFGVLQALGNFVFVALANASGNVPLMWACIGVENLCGGMGTAAFVAFLMSLCEKEYAATQYALFSSIMTLTRTFAGPLTGYLAKSVGWAWYFGIAAALALPGLGLLVTLRPLLDDRKSAPAGA